MFKKLIEAIKFFFWPIETNYNAQEDILEIGYRKTVGKAVWTYHNHTSWIVEYKVRFDNSLENIRWLAVLGASKINPNQEFKTINFHKLPNPLRKVLKKQLKAIRV